jgi:hypothetical protein
MRTTDYVKLLAVLIMIGLTVRNPTAAVSVAHYATNYVRSALAVFTHPVHPNTSQAQHESVSQQKVS